MLSQHSIKIDTRLVPSVLEAATQLAQQLNNTIPDGGVAPRHLLRLDRVTRKDLKGQKKM